MTEPDPRQVEEPSAAADADPERLFADLEERPVTEHVEVFETEHDRLLVEVREALRCGTALRRSCVLRGPGGRPRRTRDGSRRAGLGHGPRLPAAGDGHGVPQQGRYRPPARFDDSSVGGQTAWRRWTSACRP